MSILTDLFLTFAKVGVMTCSGKLLLDTEGVVFVQQMV